MAHNHGKRGKAAAPHQFIGHNRGGVFDKILKQYTKTYEVVQVKTTNMGSLFKLTYNITLKNAEEEKALIDALRCRNGNLEISVSKQETIIGEL